MNTHTRICMIAGLLLVALAAYLNFYAWFPHWLPLDRWLYRHRGDGLFRHVYTLPSLGVGALLLGYVSRSWGGLDVFNQDSESFPQEQRRRRNAYSVNWRMQYLFHGRMRKGWINLIAPFRGLLVLGSPGSGKTRYIVQPLIEQQMKKGFALFVYDFKFPDLSRLAYRCWQDNPNGATFHIIHFDDLSRSQRCNPLDPSTLTDLADATESARTILLGLNREWIRRQGDFFVESAINFVTAIIWFLRRYEGGKYCTLPHVIEMMQTPYDHLFTVLRTEPDIAFLISPFVSAYLENVMPQLEGQIAGAKIALARLSAPHIYYVLSGNDFGLDINNPASPRIVCMGNNPQKQQVYGAVLSLYVSRLIRQVNRSGGIPCSLVFDEFPTLYFNGMDTLLATARSNRVAATIVVQDMAQLRKEYGRDLADVLLNITGNVISGQVSGDSARQLSERFGRIQQARQSTHTNPREQSTGTSVHLDPALPPSRIATLSSGEMVGILADAPDQPVRLKWFHGKVLRRGKEPPLGELPMLEKLPGPEVVAANYHRIQQEVQDMVQEVMYRVLNEDALKHLAVRR